MQLQPNKKLHSRIHLLADDLSNALGEPKRFASYLGIAKRHYESDLRALLRRVLEKTDFPVDARGKYFFASLRGLPKILLSRRHRKKKKTKRDTKKSSNGKSKTNRKNT